MKRTGSCLMFVCALFPSHPGKAATQDHVTLDVAMAGGCLSPDEVNVLLDRTRMDGGLGSQTASRIAKFQYIPNSATKLKVTDPATWVFRGQDGPPNHWQVKSLTDGILKSKAHRYLELTHDTEQEFWQTNGPRVTPTAIATDERMITAMQMLAIKNSDEPKSQFISVALDYDVAEGYASEYIYKFQANPNSSVLGMRSCSLHDGGELQFQIPDGTPIANLHRKKRTSANWELYIPTKNVWVVEPEMKNDLKRALPGFEHVGQYYSNDPYLYDDANGPTRGSLADCAQRCAATSSCKYFTYAYADMVGRGQFCTLFGEAISPLATESDYQMYKRN